MRQARLHKNPREPYCRRPELEFLEVLPYPPKKKEKKNLQPEQLRSILSFNNFFSTVLGQGLQLGLG